MAEHLTPREAATITKMSVSWLEKRRRDGNGPPWHRVPGTRRVYYDRRELENWMSGPPANRRRPKTDGAAKGITWSDMANTERLQADDMEGHQ
jgi:hypothetical protein